MSNYSPVALQQLNKLQINFSQLWTVQLQEAKDILLSCKHREYTTKTKLFINVTMANSSMMCGYQK